MAGLAGILAIVLIIYVFAWMYQWHEKKQTCRRCFPRDDR